MYHFGVKKCHRLAGPLGSELDCSVIGVYYLDEFSQVFFIVWPDCEDIVYTPPPSCCFFLDLLQQVKKKPTTWWRCTDDIFAIWPHDDENLRKFIEVTNYYHRTIKFTVEWSRESVTFFDTKVIRDGNKLITDLYTKPPDAHQYVHQCRCHP